MCARLLTSIRTLVYLLKCDKKEGNWVLTVIQVLASTKVNVIASGGLFINCGGRFGDIMKAKGSKISSVRSQKPTRVLEWVMLHVVSFE